MVQLCDHLTLDAPRRTSDGYLAVTANAARTGVYQYAGREVDPDNAHGLRDTAIVNVLRDEKTVFDQKAVHSFIGKPVTDDHPTEAVNASNWRDHARGVVMGAEWREGGRLAFDLLLTDADAIAKVDAGKRELSNGYEAGLQFGDFTAADGTKCQARQTSIKGNHVALVDRGRAGPDCAIRDASHRFALCDANPAAVRGYSEKPHMTKITLDGGLLLDLADADAVAAAISKFTADAATAAKALADAQTQLATVTTESATKDAKIATLETQLADAKLSPAALRDAAKSFAQVCDKAKAMGVTVTDAMDEPAIKAAVVASKLGDRAKDWTVDQIAASFDTLTADAKSVVTLNPTVIGDAASLERQAFDASVSNLNAWRNPAKSAA